MCRIGSIAMNKIIKQKEKSGEYSSDINIDKSERYIYLMQCDDILKINKDGAKQLIEVLKEFTNEPN